LEFKELPTEELLNAVVFSRDSGSYHEPILPILELIFSDPRVKLTSEIISSLCVSREEIFDLAFSKLEKTDENMNNFLETACDERATGLITKLCEIHKYQAKVLTKQMDRAIESIGLEVVNIFLEMGVEPSCFDRVAMLVRQMECKSQPRLLLQPQFDHCLLLDAPSLWKRYIDTPKLQKAIHHRTS